MSSKTGKAPVNKILSYVRPFQPILPEIEKPKKKVELKERLLWTLVVLFVYLVCCQIPVYGLPTADKNSKDGDPFYKMRMLLASNRGTLMELGISPIVTSGLIMQLVLGAKIIDVDPSSTEENELLKSAKKLLGLVICVVEAVAYVLSGMYGDVVDIGALNALLIIFQLVFAGVLVLCLDELLEKEYGLGSGISLFIATNICEIVMWKSFSINSYQTITGNYEYEGGIVALFHLLITKEDKVLALQRAFYRNDMGLPNITNLMSTVFILLVVVWCQGIVINIKLKSSKGQSGQEAKKPIKLFYTSNMPVILLTAAVSNIYFFSQILYKRFPDNRIVGLFGSWSTTGMEAQSQLRPVGGLAYMVTAPADMESAFSDPIHAILYMSFMILSCGGLSFMWIGVSGSSPKEEAKKMQAQGMCLAGARATAKHQADDYTVKVLNKYIPMAALLGGMSIGVLTIVADFMGAIGSGTGLLLAVTTIYEYYEQIHSEVGNDFSKVWSK